MKDNIITKILLLLVLLIPFFSGKIYAGNDKELLISGVVCNEQGIPLQGVVVSLLNGRNKTLTLSNGKYAIKLEEECRTISFSAIGYNDQQVSVDDKEQVNVNLIPTVNNLEELVHLGYSSQLKSDVSGAVSTVTGDELSKSPVAGLPNSFAGKFSGLYTFQGDMELGLNTASTYVRGICANRANGPTVIIDGIVFTYDSGTALKYLTPSEIESVTILKDASTQALYGIQGSNGVIVVTTKKGTPGKFKINVRVDQSLQQMTTKPTFINSAEYAQLRNEAAYNDGYGSNYYFTDSQIENFKSGANRDLYPNNNWYDMYLKDFALMERVNLDVSGGSKKVTYYSNFNCMHQGSQFKTDQTEYNTNLDYCWMNFRSNVNAKINDYLGAYLNLAGNIERIRTPGSEIYASSLYTSLFYHPSTMFGPLTPTEVDEETGETSGGEVIVTNNAVASTYGMLNRSGYTKRTLTNIYAQFGLNLDMKFITPGLEASGILSYRTFSINALYTTKSYEKWIRTDDYDVLEFNQYGSDTNSTLTYSKAYAYFYYLTYKGLLNYHRDFGPHSVSGMAYAFYQDLSTTDTSSPESLPYMRLSSGFEASYAYNHKYLLKFDVGYSGSEQYARSHRFATTPAVSAAWVVSKESFMEDLGWLSNLKLRTSYGKTANDICNLDRYAYADNITFSSGGNISSLAYTITENSYGNESIEAEIATKQNFGLDLGFFNELFFSVDIFKEKMDNMVISGTASIPTYQGIPLDNYPSTNSGEFENKGVEVVVGYTKKLNKNLSVTAGGFVTSSKNTVIDCDETELSEDYAYRKNTEGYAYGQEWGYLVDYSNGNGFFNSESELENSNLTYDIGTPRVGDLIFQDLNGDNTINEKDKAPIGKGALPHYYYGFSGGINYKSFDLSFLFQGVAKWSGIYSGMGIYETSYDGVYGSLHRNAWTEERYSNGEKITAPALALTTSTSHNSNDYYNYNRSYLCLRNLEIGCRFEKLAQKISAQQVKFILSAQNLFTWDKMKSDDFGPEAGSYYSLPVYRTYNIGVSLQF